MSIIHRLKEGLVHKRPGEFFVELVLIVAGILIALAIDGWVADARDRQTEQVYLGLLVRDVREIRGQIETQIEFEDDQVDKGARAYAALSVPDPRANRDEIRTLMGVLSARRTLSLNSTTYSQMVSSGHLQLIRNRELRDRIVRYFADLERNERIAEKNNQLLMDELYVPFLMRIGITIPVELDQVLPSLQDSNRFLLDTLGEDVRYPEDRVLSAPADADSWNDIRRQVLFRTRVAGIGRLIAQRMLDTTAGVIDALEAELGAH